jgi:hypothetical protein
VGQSRLKLQHQEPEDRAARPSMVKTDCLNPSHGGNYLSCGTVLLPASDGMDGRYDTPIQPVSEPACKEQEMT